MDRDALDLKRGDRRSPSIGVVGAEPQHVLPGGDAPRMPAAVPRDSAVPHVRAHAIQPRAMLPRTGSRKAKAMGAYAVWIFACVLAGILSYHIAPEIFVRLESPARATEPR